MEQLYRQIEQWKGEAETAHDELCSHGASNYRQSLAYYDGIIEAYTAVLRLLTTAPEGHNPNCCDCDHCFFYSTLAERLDNPLFVVDSEGTVTVVALTTSLQAATIQL